MPRIARGGAPCPHRRAQRAGDRAQRRRRCRRRHRGAGAVACDRLQPAPVPAAARRDPRSNRALGRIPAPRRVRARHRRRARGPGSPARPLRPVPRGKALRPALERVRGARAARRLCRAHRGRARDREASAGSKAARDPRSRLRHRNAGVRGSGRGRGGDLRRCRRERGDAGAGAKRRVLRVAPPCGHRGFPARARRKDRGRRRRVRLGDPVLRRPRRAFRGAGRVPLARCLARALLRHLVQRRRRVQRARAFPPFAFARRAPAFRRRLRPAGVRALHGAPRARRRRRGRGDQPLARRAPRTRRTAR